MPGKKTHRLPKSEIANMRQNEIFPWKIPIWWETNMEGKAGIHYWKFIQTLWMRGARESIGIVYN